MRRRGYTRAQEEWIYQNWVLSRENGVKSKSNKELCEDFNTTFGTSFSYRSLENKASDLRHRGWNKGIDISEDDWICENYYKLSRMSFIEEYNKKFRYEGSGRARVGRSIENYAFKLLKKRGMYKGPRSRDVWDRKCVSPEEAEWIIANKPLMTSSELVKAYNEKFGRNVKTFNSLKVNVYRTGRNMKESSCPVCDRESEHSRLIVGSIVDAGRYRGMFIKVRDMSNREVSEWKKAHGKKVRSDGGGGFGIVYDPRFERLDKWNLKLSGVDVEGAGVGTGKAFIIHLDNDYRNCEVSNLRIVSKSVYQSINKRGWQGMGEAAVLTAEALDLIKNEGL